MHLLHYAITPIDRIPQRQMLSAPVVAEITFGRYTYDNPDGSAPASDEPPTLEMAMRWYLLRSDQKPVACLMAFNDSWSLFEVVPHLFEELAIFWRVWDRSRMQPEQFCHLLERHGFKRLPVEELAGIHDPVRFAKDFLRLVWRVAGSQTAAVPS